MVAQIDINCFFRKLCDKFTNSDISPITFFCVVYFLIILQNVIYWFSKHTFFSALDKQIQLNIFKGY